MANTPTMTPRAKRLTKTTGIKTTGTIRTMPTRRITIKGTTNRGMITRKGRSLKAVSRKDIVIMRDTRGMGATNTATIKNESWHCRKSK
jgi:hypothetical protein